MMRPMVRIFLLLTLAAVLAAGAEPLAEMAREWEFLRIRDVEVVGNQLIPDSQVVAALALTRASSMLDRRGDWEDRVRSHPVVREARVKRRLPGTLRVEVEERAPVAFVPGAALAPVDGTGRRLPLDLEALSGLDLPVIPASLSDGELEQLAGEMERLLREEPGFSALVSHVQRESTGGWVAHLSSPRVQVLFHPPLSSARLQDGLRVLEDAMRRNPQEAPRAVDLRFADQVVLRLAPSTGN